MSSTVSLKLHLRALVCGCGALILTMASAVALVGDLARGAGDEAAAGRVEE
jgi:hypothetical protein